MKKWLFILVSLCAFLSVEAANGDDFRGSPVPFEHDSDDDCPLDYPVDVSTDSRGSVSTIEADAAELEGVSRPETPFNDSPAVSIVHEEKKGAGAAKASAVIIAHSLAYERLYAPESGAFELPLYKGKWFKAPISGVCPLNPAKSVIEFRRQTAAVLWRRFGLAVEEIKIVSGVEVEAGLCEGKALSRFESIKEIIARLKTAKGEAKGYIRIIIAPRS